MILCIQTAVPPHHVGIAARGSHVGTRDLASLPLPSGRESETILQTIDRLFKKIKKRPRDLTGVVVVTGPGGFTSLRIGVTIANAFASQLNIPIVGITTEEWQNAPGKTSEKKWLRFVGTRDLASLQRQPIEPNYGRPPTITPSKNSSMRPQHSSESSI